MVRYSLNGNRIFSGTGPHVRAGFLDEARGFCIILMVLYHAAFDIIYIFGWDIVLPGGSRLIYGIFTSPVLRFAQPFVAGIFIFISGIVCRYSRNNLKRGVIALALGLAISAVTIYFMPGQAVYFGILHFMGTSMILFALLRSALDKLRHGVGLLFCLLLFVFTLGVPGGYIGVAGLWTLAYPVAWTQAAWMIPLGFSGAGVDHFPLLPWLFLFLAGSYMGIPFVSREMPDFFYRRRCPLLSAIGKRTIYIYVLHQPIVYGILWGIDRAIAGFQG